MWVSVFGWIVLTGYTLQVFGIHVPVHSLPRGDSYTQVERRDTNDFYQSVTVVDVRPNQATSLIVNPNAHSSSPSQSIDDTTVQALPTHIPEPLNVSPYPPSSSHSPSMMGFDGTSQSQNESQRGKNGSMVVGSGSTASETSGSLLSMKPLCWKDWAAGAILISLVALLGA